MAENINSENSFWPSTNNFKSVYPVRVSNPRYQIGQIFEVRDADLKSLIRADLQEIRDAFESGRMGPIIRTATGSVTTPLHILFGFQAYSYWRAGGKGYPIHQRTRAANYILSQGVPINFRDTMGTLAIYQPILKQDWPMVLYLLQKGGNGTLEYLQRTGYINSIKNGIRNLDIPVKIKIHQFLNKHFQQLKQAVENYKKRSRTRAALRQTIGSPFTTDSNKSYLMYPELVGQITEFAEGKGVAMGGYSGKRKTRRRNWR